MKNKWILQESSIWKYQLKNFNYFFASFHQKLKRIAISEIKSFLKLQEGRNLFLSFFISFHFQTTSFCRTELSKNRIPCLDWSKWSRYIFRYGKLDKSSRSYLVSLLNLSRYVPPKYIEQTGVFLECVHRNKNW